MTEQLDIFATSNSESEEKKEERLPQESSLSPLHWELYRLIYHNSFVEHRKTTQKEICDAISGFDWNNEETVHDHCPKVWTYIKDNNESMEHSKIIISKNFEYWIGSEEETKDFLLGLWKALEPRLSRYWKYTQKVKMDGLGRLFDKNGNPLTSKCSQFFECFNDYNIELQKEINKDESTDN